MSPEAVTRTAEFSRSVFPHLGGDRDPASDAASSRGYAAGYLAGLRSGAAEMERRTAAVDRAATAATERDRDAVDRGIAALTAAAAAFDDRALPLIVDVQELLAVAAVEIAEAVLGAELSDRETSAASAMRRALAHVDPATVLAVRMSQDDLAAAERVAALDLPGLRLVADAALSAGDAVVELPDGFLDARIGTAVTRVRAALVDPS